MESKAVGDRAPTPEEIAGMELRRRRQVLGWSQEEVARRMAASGYPWHQTTAGKTETGRRPLRLNEAVALAGIFGMPLQELLAPFPVDLDDIADIDSEIQAAEERRAELAREVDSMAALHAETEAAMRSAQYAYTDTRATLDRLTELLTTLESQLAALRAYRDGVRNGETDATAAGYQQLVNALRADQAEVVSQEESG